MKLENGITALVYNQGAGGNCNVLKEIVEPAGGRFDIRKVLSGDKSLSVLELWGAEFQENDGLLIQPSSLDDFTAICNRECAPFSVVGYVTGDGRVVVEDSDTGETPVDLELEKVLGDLPRKTFVDER
jgi:phosphoribosylformylglycinamidine synthase